MKKNKEINYGDVIISYSTRSGLGCRANYRYQQHIVGTLSIDNPDGESYENIGRISGDKLLIGAASEEGCGSMYVFDTEQYLADIGWEIYDYETDNFREELQKHFNFELIDRDVLILTRIEILPEFRNAEIGKHLIKDFYNNFIGGCGLMVLKCFPIQLENGILERDSEWVDKMEYNKFEKDEKIAKRQLQNYYKSLGFQAVPKVSKELLFICPSLVNKKFGAIELE